MSVFSDGMSKKHWTEYSRGEFESMPIGEAGQLQIQAFMDTQALYKELQGRLENLENVAHSHGIDNPAIIGDI